MRCKYRGKEPLGAIPKAGCASCKGTTPLLACGHSENPIGQCTVEKAKDFTGWYCGECSHITPPDAPDPLANLPPNRARRIARELAGNPLPHYGRDGLQKSGPKFTTAEKPQWISLRKMLKATHKLLTQIPADATGIVAIPRSGMMPASILATLLHLPLYEVQKDGALRELGFGSRGRNLPFARGPGPLVVIDDSVYGGGAMNRTRQHAAKWGRPVVFAALYVRPSQIDTVDLFAELVESPHLMEWNIFNNGPIGGRAADPALFGGIALDMDGIICHDPEAPDADEGEGLEKYKAWLVNAKPYLLPRTVEVPLIITARLEQWRADTEAWLAKYGVKYKQLVMHPALKASERTDVAVWKAGVLRDSECKWYIESHRNQARLIAELSGKRTICPATEEVFG